jgi:hypothetical protein
VVNINEPQTELAKLAHHSAFRVLAMVEWLFAAGCTAGA